MTPEQYKAALHCGCIMDYYTFKAWLSEIYIDEDTRSYLLAHIQQTGGLSYGDWMLLLDSVTYINGNKLHYQAAYINNYLCMGELVTDVLYTDTPTQIFNNQFTLIFV